MDSHVTVMQPSHNDRVQTVVSSSTSCLAPPRGLRAGAAGQERTCPGRVVRRGGDERRADRTDQDAARATARDPPWDRGKELAAHAQFTLDTGTKVLFAGPHALWQRPSNENTGLLGQHFPQGTDLPQWSIADIEAVVLTLNNWFRETLGWKTPVEVLDEQLRSLQQPGEAPPIEPAQWNIWRERWSNGGRTQQVFGAGPRYPCRHGAVHDHWMRRGSGSHQHPSMHRAPRRHDRGGTGLADCRTAGERRAGSCAG